jgi:hypothetical protein
MPPDEPKYGDKIKLEIFEKSKKIHDSSNNFK